MYTLLVSAQLLVELLILLVILHYFFKRREESVGYRFLTEANSRNWLRCKFLWGIAANIRIMLAIAYLVFVLELLDLSMEAFVLKLEVVVYLH